MHGDVVLLGNYDKLICLIDIWWRGVNVTSSEMHGPPLLVKYQWNDTLTHVHTYLVLVSKPLTVW